MHEYFTKIVEDCQHKLDEVLAFFKGQKGIAPPSYDDKTKSYICQDGFDPDFLIDSIVNGEMGAHEGDALMKEGSLTKRSDGRWMGRFYDNGVQRCVYAKTKEECERKVKEAIKERDKAEDELQVTRKNRLEQWVTIWFNDYIVPNKSASYTRTIRSFLNKHFWDSKIAKKEIGKLTPIDAQRFIASVKSPSVRATVYIIMNTAMRSLKKNRIIKENVFEQIDKPKRGIAKKYIPTDKELLAWLEANKGHWVYHVSRFLATTGLRIGEALGLDRKDIDYTAKLIHVTKAYNSTTRHVQKPKTRASTRDVPLSLATSVIIAEFPSHDQDALLGFVPKFHMVSKVFNDHADRFGFKRLTLHGLRHYFATKCFEAGIPPKVVQGWLGHASYKMTMDTYTHVRDAFETEEAMKLDSLFKV